MREQAAVETHGRANDACASGARHDGCPRCAGLPDVPCGPGRLFLHVPVPHLRRRVTDALDASGASWVIDGDDGRGGRLYVMPTTDVATSAASLFSQFSGEALAEIRAVFEPLGASLSPADYFAARPAGTLLQRIRHEWLTTLLAERRVVSYFQPIVEAQTPNRVYGYECLMRGAGPRLVYPDELLSAARGADLLFQLDLAARLAAIRGAAAHGVREVLFINFSPAAIYDPAFCLRSTIAAVSEVGLRPEQIVFEVTETERVPSTTNHLVSILDQYRASGFRVALDDVGSGYSSLVLLGEVRPDFVKLDGTLTAGVVEDPFRAVIAETLIEAALKTGMKVVAEHIEDAAGAEWFASRGVHYLQGYHFGRPAATPIPAAPAPAAR